MHRGGVRELVVPPGLAFGDAGKVVAVSPNDGGAVTVRPGATLTYLISLEDVSPSYL